METPLAPKTLRDATGISQSYASMILNKKRAPSRPLAIYIYRKTGWRHSLLSALTDDQIDTLEAVEPYAPAQVPA